MGSRSSAFAERRMQANWFPLGDLRISLSWQIPKTARHLSSRTCRSHPSRYRSVSSYFFVTRSPLSTAPGFMTRRTISRTPSPRRRCYPRRVRTIPASHESFCADVPLDVPRVVEGLLIVVTVEALTGRTVAKGGGCQRHPNEIPYVGRVTFAPHAFERDADADFERLVRHEFLHVLGFGTMHKWNQHNDTDDPHFPGPNAVAAFDSLGGANYPGAKVPIVRRSGHWRESVMGCEVMSSGCDHLVNSGFVSPTSAITLAALADLGYTVDLTKADPYTVCSDLVIT